MMNPLFNLLLYGGYNEYKIIHRLLRQKDSLGKLCQMWFTGEIFFQKSIDCPWDGIEMYFQHALG